MRQKLEVMSPVELNNLFFKETAEFVAAIGVETAEQLEKRRKKIRLIDKAIEKNKLKQPNAKQAKS